MTVTTQPSTEELLARARQIAEQDGQLPSANRLSKALGIRWERGRDLTARLAAEREQRRLQRRDRMRRARSRRSPVRALPDRLTPLPKIADVVASEPAAPVVEPVAEARREEPAAVVAPVAATSSRRPPTWPVLLLAAPAFVAIWSGWVDLGRLTGFGVVHPLPGIWDAARLDTAITLPVGLETYAAYALWVWLSGRVPTRARRFAKRSAIGALVLGALGQVAYHLMVAAGMTSAPWQITTAVACLPVAVLGMGAALAHLVRAEG